MAEETKKGGAMEEGSSIKIRPGKITGIFAERSEEGEALLDQIYNKEGAYSKILDKKDLVYFPNSQGAFEGLKVFDLGDLFSSIYENFDREKFEKDLAYFSFTENSLLSSLNPTEEKKFRLLLTFSFEADSYLLDDPLSGLGLIEKDFVKAKLLREYGRQMKTLLIFSRDIRDFEDLLDYLVILRGGRVIFQGEAEKIWEKEGLGLEDFYRKLME